MVEKMGYSSIPSVRYNVFLIGIVTIWCFVKRLTGVAKPLSIREIQRAAFEDIAVTYQTVELHPFYCLCVLRMSSIMAVISEPRI